MKTDPTRESLVDELLEFGLPLTDAELIAPALLPLMSDPRGIEATLRQDHPWLAEKLGVAMRN